MKEIWRDVKDYEGLYKVSNLGNIKSLDRIGVTGDRLSGRLKKKSINSRGYFTTGLTKNGIKKIFSTHRIVALAFLEKIVGKEIVNHKNGVKTDNRVENLEWCTHSENSLHSYKNFLQKRKKGESVGNSKLKQSDVEQIRKLYVYGDRNFSTHALARKFCISRSVVQSIVTNKTWKL